MGEVERAPRRGLSALAAAVLLLVAFVRYVGTSDTAIRYGGSHLLTIPGYISEGEFRLFLAAFALLVPGCVALGYGLQPWLGQRLVGTLRWLENAGGRRGLGVACLLAAGLFVVYQVGHSAVLAEQVFTDDENAVATGGRMWVEGDLWAKDYEPAGAFSDLYLMHRDGRMASIDWPGVIGFSALSLATGLHGTLYALFAALTGLAVALAARTLWGARAGVVAGSVWLCSTMATVLSMTTHAHVASRAWLAFAVLAYAHLLAKARHDQPCLAAGFWLGLLTGIGFNTRVFEVGTLMAPIGAMVLWRARNSAAFRSGALGCTLGVAGPLALHALYNWHMTGEPWMPPRHSSFAVANHLAENSVVTRLGTNLGHNVLMLALWFFGPAGLALATLGVRRAAQASGELATGVGLALMVALFHDDIGVHTVGPIHYSETAVPLTLLASSGIVRVVDWAREHRIDTSALAVSAAGYGIALWGLLATIVPSLQGQSEFVAFHRDLLASSNVHNAIVIARDPRVVDATLHSPNGSWQLRHPNPDPYYRDDVLWAKWNADPRTLHARHPERELYTLEIFADGPELKRLDTANLPGPFTSRPDIVPKRPGAKPPRP